LVLAASALRAVLDRVSDDSATEIAAASGSVFLSILIPQYFLMVIHFKN
jgi:hypothetical protein